MIATASTIKPSALEDKIYKIIATRKRNTEARNTRIRLRFNELYNERRQRIDDVILTLQEEFCLSKSTIEGVLKS